MRPQYNQNHDLDDLAGLNAAVREFVRELQRREREASRSNVYQFPVRRSTETEKGSAA